MPFTSYLCHCFYLSLALSITLCIPLCRILETITDDLPRSAQKVTLSGTARPLGQTWLSVAGSGCFKHHETRGLRANRGMHTFLWPITRSQIGFCSNSHTEMKTEVEIHLPTVAKEGSPRGQEISFLLFNENKDHSYLLQNKDLCEILGRVMCSMSVPSLSPGFLLIYTDSNKWVF